MKFSFLAMMAACFVLCNATMVAAQDLKRVPETSKANAPSLPTSSQEKPKVGPLASAAQVVVISNRGAFALTTATAGDCAVFEYNGLGFDEKVTYMTSQSGFLYFQVSNWQLIVAIRETSPFDIWFFVNGGSTPVKYVDFSHHYSPAH